MFSPMSFKDLGHQGSSSPPGSEPMTLGSPVSSPKSNANISQNFLPPYLFGEALTSPASGSPWVTPTRQQNASFNSSFSGTPFSSLREKKNIFSTPPSSTSISSPNVRKSGGPPVQGLLYSMPSPTKSLETMKLENVSKISDIRVSEGLNASGVLTPSKTFSINNTSHMSPAQLDPFFTQGEALKSSEQLDESWVTIFGFPVASVSYILQQFSQYGNIIEHKMAPSGNWMHIRYQSKLQAKKALSKNGKVFGGNIMVGVKPCIEMDVMECAKENSLQESSKITSPENIANIAELNPTKPNFKNIRPLTQGFKSPSAEGPTQKSEGIFSKAVGFLWKS